MNLGELSTYLFEEAYNPNVYHVGPSWGACADAHCIERVGSQFEIFYVERGQRGEPLQQVENESDACAAFLAVLDRERFSRAHCVGFFAAKSDADALAKRLFSADIGVHRDEIPYGGPADMRYRLFVFGRDKTLAQEIVDREKWPVE